MSRIAGMQVHHPDRAVADHTIKPVLARFGDPQQGAGCFLGFAVLRADQEKSEEARERRRLAAIVAAVGGGRPAPRARR